MPLIALLLHSTPSDFLETFVYALLTSCMHDCTRLAVCARLENWIYNMGTDLIVMSYLLPPRDHAIVFNDSSPSFAAYHCLLVQWWTCAYRLTQPEHVEFRTKPWCSCRQDGFSHRPQRLFCLLNRTLPLDFRVAETSTTRVCLAVSVQSNGSPRLIGKWSTFKDRCQLRTNHWTVKFSLLVRPESIPFGS